MAFELGLIDKWKRLDLPLEAFIEVRLPLVHNGAKKTLEQLYVALILYSAVLVIAVLAFVKEICLKGQQHIIVV